MDVSIQHYVIVGVWFVHNCQKIHFLGHRRFWEATNVAVLRGKTARPKTCGSVPSFKADDGTGTIGQLVLCFFWNKKKKLMMAVLTRI